MRLSRVLAVASLAVLCGTAHAATFTADRFDALNNSHAETINIHAPFLLFQTSGIARLEASSDDTFRAIIGTSSFGTSVLYEGRPYTGLRATSATLISDPAPLQISLCGSLYCGNSGSSGSFSFSAPIQAQGVLTVTLPDASSFTIDLSSLSGTATASGPVYGGYGTPLQINLVSQSAWPSATLTAVPEPATWPLLGASLLFVLRPLRRCAH